MSSEESQGQQITLDKLSIEQLTDVKRQLDEELQHLTQSFQALKQAQLHFKNAKENIDSINAKSISKQILVPLTSSLYVPGKIADPDNVVIDIGTGYYVEKSTKDAKTFYNTKVLKLGKKLDELAPLVERKTENRAQVMEYLQIKISERGKADAENKNVD